jgi:integrase
MLREEPRERFLTNDEFRALIGALNVDDDAVAASAVALAAVTGARKSEVLGATWPNVDYARGWLTVPVAKDGKKHRVTLSVRPEGC